MRHVHEWINTPDGERLGMPKSCADCGKWQDFCDPPTIHRYEAVTGDGQPMTRIPLDPNGYSVNPNTGTIHTRYADHGNGTRTRTEKGVRTLLDGKQGKACATCYGKTPRYPEPPRPPVKRRSGPDAPQ